MLVTLAAIWFGYRAGPAGAAVVRSWSGAGDVTARFVASLLVFGVLQVVGLVVVNRSVSLRGPPGRFDRVAGAMLSALWYPVAVTAAMLVAVAASSLSPGTERVLEGSRAVRLITAEEGPVGPAVSRLLGDRILESLVNLNRMVGRSRMVIEGEDRVDLAPVELSDIREIPESAGELFEKLNLVRFEEGVPVLSWSGALAEVAGGHGREMYVEGYFSHRSPVTGSVADRLEAVSIPFLAVGENLALSPTVDSVHEGLLGSPSHRAVMLDRRFRRVGIAALEGPLGLMVVQVFSG